MINTKRTSLLKDRSGIVKEFKIKTMSLLLITCLLLTSFGLQTTNILAEVNTEDIQIIIDGEFLESDTPAIVEQGRTLVPLRAIFESLFAEVFWDSAEQKVTATKGSTTITLYIGDTTAWINGIQTPLDVPPKIVNNRTLVPVRFVSESLGADVWWNGLNRTVVVTSEFIKPNIINAGISIIEETPTLYPAWVTSGLELSPVEKAYDSSLIYKDLQQVQPTYDVTLLKPTYEHNNYLPDLKKLDIWSTGCDYSSYVTFQGNQGSSGGCIGRSMVHIMNILKEREIPYTPDVSFWYLQSRQEELADGGPLDTQFVLEHNGLSPEAYSPSDYDKVIKTTNADGSTNYDFSEMIQPNGWTNYLASYYKMKESAPYDPTIENIRYLLRTFGPLLGSGDMVLIQGPSPAQGHAVTIVGYDDNAETIKCLNSWGDTWGNTNDGYFEVPYDKLSENFSTVKYYESIFVDRTGLTTQNYSARIHVETGTTTRNELKVTLGLDNKSPFTIWDTPNQVIIKDFSKSLLIDVPLPIYAIDNWPPNNNSKWYVEVTNTSSSDTATLKEITFVHLYKNTDGSFVNETFKSNESGSTIGPNQTVKFYVPNN